MKKIKARIVSIILTLMLSSGLFVAFPMTASAAEGIDVGTPPLGEEPPPSEEPPGQEVAPYFTTHPVSQTIAENGTLSFTVAAAYVNPTPPFQWEVSADGGATWSGITNGSVYSGATTNTLTLTNTPLSYNDYQYRCVSPTSEGDVASNAATLTVNAAGGNADGDANEDGYHDGDVAVINRIIANNGLDWMPNAPASWLTVDDLFAVSIHWTDGRIDTLDLSTKGLTGNLDLSGLTELKGLDCGNNQLTALDVSENPALVDLSCGFNALTSLDVSQNTMLNFLYCNDNKLTTLDVSQNPSLWGFSCNNNYMPQAVGSGVTGIGSVDVFTSWDSGGGFEYSPQNVAPADGDANGDGYHDGDVAVINRIIANNGLDLTPNDPASWSQFAPHGGNIVWMDSRVVSLSLNDGEVTGNPDLSGLTGLKSLSCSGNQLTSLDVSKNFLLEILYCGDNQLTSLDVSKNPALRVLDCEGNALTSLDVRENTSLEYIYCESNQLTSLDVSHNTGLRIIHCQNNYMPQAVGGGVTGIGNVTRFTSWDTASTFGVYEFVYSPQNVAPADGDANGDGYHDGDVAVINRIIANNGLDLTPNDPANWPEIGPNGGNIVWRGSRIIALGLSNEKLTGKLDLSGLTELDSLDCSNNQLTGLDGGENAKLKMLHCEYNQLTELDISKNTGLSFLGCTGNQLTTLDTSQNIALWQLLCSKNKLTALDVSQNTGLGTLHCQYNYMPQAVGSGVTGIENLTYFTSWNTTGRYEFVYSPQNATSVPVAVVTVAPANHAFDAIGTTAAFTATVSPANATDKTVAWATSNAAVAAVDQNGNVTATGNGSATITATSGGVSGSALVTVAQKVTGVKLGVTALSLKPGASATLLDIISPVDAPNKNVTFTTSNAKVAKVTAGGKVTVAKTAKAGQKARITVTTADGGFKASCVVTVVTKATSQVKSVKMSRKTASLTTGGSVKLTATVSPKTVKNKKVTWATSDAKIATVTTKGVVRATGVGKATITATSQDGGKAAKCVITVKTPVKVTGVKLNKTKLTLRVDKTSKLKAALIPSGATNKGVTWKSSKRGVATVNAAGVVKGIKKGTAIITVTTKDGRKTATCRVTVR